jgi:hypothetical protein
MSARNKHSFWQLTVVKFILLVIMSTPLLLRLACNKLVRLSLANISTCLQSQILLKTITPGYRFIYYFLIDFHCTVAFAATEQKILGYKTT